MPEFQYRARDSSGKEMVGRRNAISPEELAEQLLKESMIPIEINIQTAVASKKKTTTDKKWWSISFSKKVSQAELQIFCRQMATLLKAGIPILTAITRLAETARDKNLIAALNDILVTLNKGQTLSRAMLQFPDIFSVFFVNLVKVGESTGRIDEVFLHLSEYIELEEDTRKKIKAALRYPMLVLISMVVALIVINTFVIPSFTQMFQEFKGNLPLPTRILMSTSNFILHYWYLLVIGIVSGVFALRYYIKTPEGSLKFSWLKLKIPVIGWIIQRITLARFAKLYAMVLRAGLTAVEGISLVGASTVDAWYAKKITMATDLIERGNTISNSISKINIFPPLVLQMITLGEESGQIETLLDNVAEFYQREVNYDLARLNDAVEPLLLVVMAGMVLVLALGVFLPMWDIASQARVS